MLDEDKVREHISLLYVGEKKACDKGVLSLSALGIEVVPHVLILIEDKEPYVRAAVAEIFGKVKYAEGMPTLLKMLGDPEWFVRKKALDALGDLEGPSAVTPISNMFRNETHPWVRQGAVAALTKISSPEAIPTLCDALNDKDHGVVKLATLALERAIPRNKRDLTALQLSARSLSSKEVCASMRAKIKKCTERLRRTSMAWEKTLRDASKGEGEEEEERGWKRFRGRKEVRQRMRGREEILREIRGMCAL